MPPQSYQNSHGVEPKAAVQDTTLMEKAIQAEHPVTQDKAAMIKGTIISQYVGGSKRTAW